VCLGMTHTWGVLTGAQLPQLYDVIVLTACCGETLQCLCRDELLRHALRVHRTINNSMPAMGRHQAGTACPLTPMPAHHRVRMCLGKLSFDAHDIGPD
jgi:hypothetical protein